MTFGHRKMLKSEPPRPERSLPRSITNETPELHSGWRAFVIAFIASRGRDLRMLVTKTGYRQIWFRIMALDTTARGPKMTTGASDTDCQPVRLGRRQWCTLG